VNSGANVNDLPDHKDDHFSGWSAEHVGWGLAGQKRALRRRQFWQSKSEKPRIEDMIRACDADANGENTVPEMLQNEACD
jgi:hypothetical protein